MTKAIKNTPLESAFKKSYRNPESVNDKSRFSQPEVSPRFPENDSIKTSFPMTGLKYTDASDIRN